MKVTIDFGEEIGPLLQEHLDGGPAVARQIKAAVKLYGDLSKAEKNGSAVGYGDKHRFSQYNTQVSPKSYLEGPF